MPVTSITVLPRDATAPKVARTWVARELNPLGLDPAKHAAVALLVSELVTSGIEHADSALVLTLRIEGELIVVNVEDSSAAKPVVGSAEDGLSGLALKIVENLAESWGVRSKDNGTKIVWFSIRRGSWK